MARNPINLLENKGPGNICNFTDNLRIHEVTQADKTGRRSCGDGDIVKYRPDAEFRLADIESEGQNQT